MPVTVFVSQLADAHIPKHGEGVTIRWDATPTEFVAAFSRANYVLSNSFHAMMFSIIFERRAAFVVPPNSVKERFEVVKMFGCDKALIPKWDAGTEIQFVDFAGVYRKMDDLRTASRDFLEMALAKAGSKRSRDMLRLPSRAFLAQAIDRSSRDAGSSGGLFGLLAETVLTHGGVVVGAAFDDDGIVRHRMARSRQDLTPLLKSKYVWSDFTRVLPDVRKELSNGNEVLFAGTPCQVAAVRNVCARNSTGCLICIDVLCHGTPAPEVFASYRAMRERQHDASLVHYDWRDKSKGWNPLRTRLRFSDGTEYIEEMNDYFFAFLYNLSLREGCGRCRWARPERGGDLTLGDAWGMMRDWFDKADNTGTSLVLVNTPRGAELFKPINGFIRMRPTSLKRARRKQVVLRHPPVRPAAARTFARIFAESGDFERAFSTARAELLEEATAKFKKVQKEYDVLSGEERPFLTRFLRRLAYHRRLKQLRHSLKELDGLLKVSVEEAKRT